MSQPLSLIPLEAPVLSRRSGVRLPKGVFALDPNAFESVYATEDRDRIKKLVNITEDLVLSRENWREYKDILKETEFIFSGWKTPALDAEFMAAVPKLRAVFYAAGSVRYCTSEAFWARDIPITTAYAANAVPVAEYTVSVALLGLKQFWRGAALARNGEGWGDHTRPISGSFRATIGLVSFGVIARRVVQILSAHDVRILVYCPYLTDDEADRFGVVKVSLHKLFQESDVVSVHTPVLPETLGLVGGDLIRLMKPDATLINTARGVILNQPSVVEALRERGDVTAILDVTHPEPPAASDPLFSLPNIIVTPHIAGSLGRECQRLGSYMADELERFLQDRPLKWRITREMAQRMA